jgi:hypothetical protein
MLRFACIIVALIVAACEGTVASRAPDDNAMVSELAPELEGSAFDQACAKCMHKISLSQSCPLWRTAPLIAIVEGPRAVATSSACGSFSGFGQGQLCTGHSAIEFRDAVLLRNHEGAKASDLFEAFFVYDAEQPQVRHQIDLDANRRYVILATRGATASTPSSQWTIQSACVLESEK